MASVFIAIVAVIFASVNPSTSVQSLEINLSQQNVATSTAGNLETIESLAASRILRDQTSSQSPPPPIIPIFAVASSSSQSIPSEATTEKKMSNRRKDAEETIYSPLHVAQCRATCLDKFASTVTSLGKETKRTPPTAGKMDDEIRLVPNLLRLKRKRRSTAESGNKFSSSSHTTTPCLQGSLECLSCWESCQFLGNKTSHTDSIGSILDCSNENLQRPCTAGCQVACSFYKELSAKPIAGIDSSVENTIRVISASDQPVIATRQKNVLQLDSGKLTWPALSLSGDVKSSVVYVVIQEYPDRKWRQIDQTTELKLDIPSQLTAAMKAKFQAVRVLAVTAKGLRAVYAPTKNTEQNLERQKKFGKEATANVANAKQNSDGDHVSLLNMTVVSESSTSAANYYSTQITQRKSRTMLPPTATTSITPSNIDATTTATDKPFVLRLVSLIHQKSLVIAELRWDAIGENPNQDYLITWELAGGGLKGHLVTDSTSVTLSLWPDTTYQIQVAQSLQNLDSDGEQQHQQPSNNYHSSSSSAASTSLQSLPLVVDTSVASFPLERPSALFASKMTYQDNKSQEDYQHDDDKVTAQEIQEEEQESNYNDDKEADHKFIAHAIFISTAFVSLVLVLLILTLTACIFSNLRKLSRKKKSCEKVNHDEEYSDSEEENGASKNGYFSSCCSVQEKDCQLLVSQETFHSADAMVEEETPSSFYSSLPFHYILRENYPKYKTNLDTTSRSSAVDHAFAHHHPSRIETNLFGYHHKENSSMHSAVPPVPPVAVITIPFSLSSSLPNTAAENKIGAQGSQFDYCNALFNFQDGSNSSNLTSSSFSTCMAPASAAPPRNSSS